MSILDAVKTGQELVPPKIIIYGPPGAGKTTLACQAPNPLLIQAEEGIGSLSVPHTPVLNRLADVETVLHELTTTDHDYKTVVLDSISAVEGLAARKVCEANGTTNIAEISFGRGFAAVQSEVEAILQELKALRMSKNVGVVIIAHSAVERYEPPDSEPFDRFTLDLDKRVRPSLLEWSDATLLLTQKAVLISEDGTKRGKRAIGDGERVVYTEGRPAWVAKNRYGLPSEMPAVWSDIQAGILRPFQKQDETENQNQNTEAE